MNNENLVSYLELQEDILVQESGDLSEDSVYTGKIDSKGGLIVNSKGLKKKPKEVDLLDANIWVEERPNDANRVKALTSNYLMWTEDSRIDNLDYRVCIQTEKDLRTQNYVVSDQLGNLYEVTHRSKKDHVISLDKDKVPREI